MDTQNAKDQDNEVAEQTDDTADDRPVEAASTPIDDVQASPTPSAITFPNKRQAILVKATANSDPHEVISTLNLSQPEALLIMVGGVANLNQDISAHLVQLFSRGIARTLADLNAIMLDNGRNAGAIKMMGQGVADREHKTILMGVALQDKVTYPDTPSTQPGLDDLEPNHTHFVLTPGEAWGDETEILFQLGAALAPQQKAVVVLVGGDNVAKKQVLEAVRKDWSVVVLKESGGLADEIGQLAQERPHFIEDPELAEIIIDGKLYFLQSTGPISSFDRLLEQLLNFHEIGATPSTLELVWTRFAQYDQSASRQQKDFSRMQLAILVLGVLATLLAIIQSYYKGYLGQAIETDTTYLAIDWALYIVLLMLPISVSVLIAAANRFSSGNKWILLRASAESLKKEIYRYRTRADIYGDQQTRRISRELKLHRKEEAISRKLMQTEVNMASLQQYSGPIPPKYGAAEGDDGLSFLTPDRYLKYRLEDQLSFYQKKTGKIEEKMRRLQWLIYIMGGVGTALVALQLEIWIAFTIAVVTALTTYLEYRQLEPTLMRYNQTAAELTSLRSWWIALTAEEQANPDNIDQLVDQTETIIHSEHAAWIQEMQDAMAELRAEKTDAQSTGSSPQTQPAPAAE